LFAEIFSDAEKLITCKKLLACAAKDPRVAAPELLLG
jgi:hypothetical protein